MSSFKKHIDECARSFLKNLYEQLTEEQKNFFNILYKSVDTIPFEKMDWAVQQIERTIIKNNSLTGEPKTISEL